MSHHTTEKAAHYAALAHEKRFPRLRNLKRVVFENFEWVLHWERGPIRVWYDTMENAWGCLIDCEPIFRESAIGKSPLGAVEIAAEKVGNLLMHFSSELDDVLAVAKAIETEKPPRIESNRGRRKEPASAQ